MGIIVAALYVERMGTYFGLANVDPWDINRDARKYAGPHPVVAHPPCERWGRYWSGGPNPRAPRRELGDDGGCFASALNSVRVFGGVLEHPEGSHAFRIHGVATPKRGLGWMPAGDGIGYVVSVDQGAYGHPARKATWLYAVSTELPSIKLMGCEPKKRLDPGPRSKESARAMRASPDYKPIPRLNRSDRIGTPPEFRDFLLSIARTVRATHG